MRPDSTFCPNTDGHHVHDYEAGRRLDVCSVCGWSRQCGLYAGGCTIGYLPLHHAPEVDA